MDSFIWNTSSQKGIILHTISASIFKSYYPSNHCQIISCSILRLIVCLVGRPRSLFTQAILFRLINFHNPKWKPADTDKIPALQRSLLKAAESWNVFKNERCVKTGHCKIDANKQTYCVSHCYNLVMLMWEFGAFKGTYTPGLICIPKWHKRMA